MDEELRKKVNKIILAIDVYDDTSVDEDEAEKATKQIMALIASYSREARIDEILKMRAVGDKVAAQASPSFEELATAYDNHILKRAADLTEAPNG